MNSKRALSYSMKGAGDLAHHLASKIIVVGQIMARGSPKPIIERWKSLGIPITAGPAPRTGALGRMTSIYCEDPDGNLVEVATYSADP